MSGINPILFLNTIFLNTIFLLPLILSISINIGITNLSYAANPAANPNPDYIEIIHSIGDKEKLNGPIFKMTLEEAHAISGLSTNEKRTLCYEMTTQWPNFHKALRLLPAMSIKTNTSLIRVLAMYFESCLSTPEEIHKTLVDIQKINGDLIRSLLQKPLAFFLPLQATNLSFNKNNPDKIIKMDILFAWVSSVLGQAIYTESCGSNELKLDQNNLQITLPENSICIAPWLLSNLFKWGKQNKLLDPSIEGVTAFKNSVDNFIENSIITNINQIPLNWYSILSWPYTNQNLPVTTNLKLLQFLYNSKDYNGLLIFMIRNSSIFSSMLPLNTEHLLPIMSESISGSLVDKIKAQSIYLLQNLPANYDSEIDSMFLATVGKYIYIPLLCYDSKYDFFNEIKYIMGSTTTGFKSQSALSTLPAGQIDLLNIQLANADADTDMRDQLGLMFTIGGSHDLEDMTNNPLFSSNYENLAIDHIIGNFLRKADNSPWVNIEEAIEELNSRQEVTKTIINKLHKNRLLQMFYLDQFDMESDETLINEIRDVAFKIETIRFDFHPIRIMIHNGFNESITGIVDNYFSNLNISEQQSIETYYKQLNNKLRRFFLATANPLPIIQKDLMQIKNSWPQLALDIENSFNKFKDLISSSDFIQKSTAMEMLFETSNKLSEQINTSQNNENYFHLVRLLKITHTMIIRYLPEINFDNFGNKEIFLKESTSYIKHLLNYSGLKISEVTPSVTSSITPSSTTTSVNIMKNFEILTNINNFVANKLKENFYPRLALFHIFTQAQINRYSPNPEYNFTMNIRQEVLPIVIENLIRTHGLGISYLFDPARIDPTALPEKKIMNEGEAYGLLKYLPQEDINRYPYRFDEILITNTLPTNLGVTAALITTVYQPLSSHVDLRTKERNTPNAFIKDALISYKNLLNKWVRIEFKDKHISIVEVTEDLARNKIKEKLSLNNYKIPLAQIQTEIGNSDKDIIDLDYSPEETSINIVGAKAFSYAHLRRLFGPKSYTPKAWAIPFHVYHWFVTTFNIEGEIEKLISDYHSSHSISSKELEERLFQIRKLFTNKVQDSNFLSSQFYQNLIKTLPTLIKSTIDEDHGELWESSKGSLRFRSSTNSEDLIGLTGAGLYESKTGYINFDGNFKKSIASALTNIWSSLWTYRAFIEREYYGINHLDVKMAVLVHRNYPQEEFNGVALSKSRLDSTFYISVARGEESITNSTGGVESDELVIIPNFPSEQFSISGRFANKVSPMLTQKNLIELIDALTKIYSYYIKIFSHVPNISNMRLDVEFKFQNNKLYIKQARPYLSK